VRKSDRPDRYPLNQLNSLVINVPAAYAFYLIPLFFPHLIWLALRTILFNFLELLLHCGGGFGLARSPYNPGLLTVIPWLALAIWYLVEADITASDWWIAIAYMLGFVIIFLGLVTYVLLASRESPYPSHPRNSHALSATVASSTPRSTPMPSWRTRPRQPERRHGSVGARPDARCPRGRAKFGDGERARIRRSLALPSSASRQAGPFGLLCNSTRDVRSRPSRGLQVLARS